MTKIILVIEGKNKGLFITEHAEKEVIRKFFLQIEVGDKLIVQIK